MRGPGGFLGTLIAAVLMLVVSLFMLPFIIMGQADGSVFTEFKWPDVTDGSAGSVGTYEPTDPHPKQFVGTILPYAQQASTCTGLPVSVIVSQWAHESYWGTSELAQTARNYAGIKWVDEPPQDFQWTMYAGYSTVTHFAADYCRVLRLPYYDHIRRLAQLGASERDIVNAFTRGPAGVPTYAEDPGYSVKINLIVPQVKAYLRDLQASASQPAA